MRVFLFVQGPQDKDPVEETWKEPDPGGLWQLKHPVCLGTGEISFPAYPGQHPLTSVG